MRQRLTHQPQVFVCRPAGGHLVRRRGPGAGSRGQALCGHAAEHRGPPATPAPGDYPTVGPLSDSPLASGPKDSNHEIGATQDSSRGQSQTFKTPKEGAREGKVRSEALSAKSAK
ncbi:hypothetical protein NDU88_003968 [Pleurodeles waltl]|uniref:Uncharacterized protein n=1 Tax=Pleurodeles waltl TaxID=8319 RepID=A0AAV7KY13_PLEWA|nr:hypothetical protein NDU88_003968 [Pleurodeles waltl]